MDYIEIKGARANNLKNCNVKFPRNKLIVFTGVSGSGKTSLAFDTLYAEGQRRYVESLSTYARQFLGQMDKPDVESITGLSPAISIDQKTTSRNPRSTVGTVTEIYDYLRLLYSRVGVLHCYKCGREIKRQTIDQIVDSVMNLGEGVKIQILSPVVRNKKGKHEKLIENIKKHGFVRVRINGDVYDLLSDYIDLNKNKKNSIDILVDRIVIKNSSKARIFESVETSLKFSEGVVLIDVIGGEELLFSENFSCIECQVSISELEPRGFSFNAPFGKCNNCDGLGRKFEIDPKLIIENDELSILDGAIKVFGENSFKEGGWNFSIFKALSKKFEFSLKEPFKNLSEDLKEKILFGVDDEIFVKYEREGIENTYKHKFEGVVNNLKRRYKESSSDYVKREIEKYMTNKVCERCNGARLRPEVLSVKFGGVNIYELTCMSVVDSLEFFKNIELTDKNKIIADPIINEITSRLSFLNNVGLSYLSLSRTASTLSGGESQRIRLATQIGSSLVGVLYVLDEPSIGLHQRDNDMLIKTLKNLRDIGNTVVVVEHDEDTIKEADFIVDVGKFAGENGGNIIYQGDYNGILCCDESITGAYLRGDKFIDTPKERRKGNGNFIKVFGARENNLKDLSVEIPLGTLTIVTGVSGSGKSTFVNEVLYKGVKGYINGHNQKLNKFEKIEGIDNIDKIIDIDQSPIGRTPRSNPATYIGVFDIIRELFSNTNDSKVRGYKPGRFSFNVKGGRCEACQGDGMIKIEMQFLSDVYVVCEVCKGSRYNKETLEVRYKGKNISDVLNMTVCEALEFFEAIPRIYNKIKTLNDVGLSYIRLGQSSTTLSGGEAQRVKLANELSKKSTGKTLYILDEPTTGLHIYDVSKLIDILKILVNSGNTVVVIEHNLDVIKNADYIIDLGPEGGINGGTIVATGTPEEICLVEKSYTGKYLRKYL